MISVSININKRPVSSFSLEDPEEIEIDEREETNPKKRSKKERVVDAAIKDATKSILSAKGFLAEAGDAHHERRLGQTVGEVQGSSEFRKTIVEATARHLSALSPNFLRDQKEANPLLYRILQFKRLGHGFSLIGPLQIGDDKQSVTLQLEGFNETLVRPMLAATFDRFAARKDHLCVDHARTWFKTIFENAIYHDNASEQNLDHVFKLVHDPNYDFPIMIGSGYNWHSTQIIIYKKYIFYCNRGAGGEGRFGITVVQIGDRSRITKEIIKKYSRRMDYKLSDCPKLDGLIALLDGKTVYQHPMKQQSVGNCTYTSFKAAIQGLLAIRYASDHPSNGEDWKHIFTKARPIYKAFTLYDREELLEDLLIDLEQRKAANERFKIPIEALVQKLEAKLLKSSIVLHQDLRDRFNRAIQKIPVVIV